MATETTEALAFVGAGMSVLEQAEDDNTEDGNTDDTRTNERSADACPKEPRPRES